MTHTIIHITLLILFCFYLIYQTRMDWKHGYTRILANYSMLLLAAIYGIYYSIIAHTIPWGLLPIVLFFGLLTKLKLFGAADLQAIIAMYFLLNQNNKHFLIVTFAIFVFQFFVPLIKPRQLPMPQTDPNLQDQLREIDKTKFMYVPYFPYITISFIILIIIFLIKDIPFI